MNDFSLEAMKFLKEKRLLLGMSQAEVANLIYGNPKCKDKISKLENGKNNLSMKTLEKYLKIFNCEFNYFKEK